MTDYKIFKPFRNLLEVGNKCLKEAISEYYFILNENQRAN
ncbi:hypothetical protein SK629_1427 [Streptococcus mitis]|uniref:Uncharacterized protein n=1 Tax=Streptococcus mitis TaxID=28037 RepID=A0A081PVS4_STRMT|nr:hypothetical protein SK629_1427 [Streptococcus mitis]